MPEVDTDTLKRQHIRRRMHAEWRRYPAIHHAECPGEALLISRFALLLCSTWSNKGSVDRMDGRTKKKLGARRLISWRNDRYTQQTAVTRNGR